MIRLASLYVRGGRDDSIVGALRGAGDTHLPCAFLLRHWTLLPVLYIIMNVLGITPNQDGWSDHFSSSSARH
jgi:hypothetical protein